MHLYLCVKEFISKRYKNVDIFCNSTFFGRNNALTVSMKRLQPVQRRAACAGSRCKMPAVSPWARSTTASASSTVKTVHSQYLRRKVSFIWTTAAPRSICDFVFYALTASILDPDPAGSGIHNSIRNILG